MPQGYNGGELLLVGGETGLWSWDVTRWESGDMGAGCCLSRDAGCTWVSCLKRITFAPAHFGPFEEKSDH